MPNSKSDHSPQISCLVADMLVYWRQFLMMEQMRESEEEEEEEGHLRCGRCTSRRGRTASSLLIASPSRTIFKRNLLMRRGPASFPFYPVLFHSFAFFSLSFLPSFHVLARFRGPPTRVSSPAPVGGRYPTPPLLTWEAFQAASMLNVICSGKLMMFLFYSSI